MISPPFIFIRNKKNSLFEAIFVTCITAFLSYGVLTNLSSSKIQNTIFISLIFLCSALSCISWFRYSRKNKILITLSDRGIAFGKEEIEWVAISTYRITEYISDGITRNICFRLKDREEELKFHLPEFDVPVDVLVNAIYMYSQQYGFLFLGISIIP